MDLNLTKYLIIFLVLTACGIEQKDERNYGSVEEDEKNLNVAIKLSEFKNYGKLLDRIRAITCNDSIPKIVIERKNLIKYIYPIEDCIPPPFDPKSNHYVTFRKGRFYEWDSNVRIQTDSLKKKIEEDFLYHRKSNNYKSYFVIIESERNEKINGIEKFIENLTCEYDELESDLKLNIAFWEVVPPLPPPPKVYSEQKIPQGTFNYELFFAEFGGRMKNAECKVKISGNKIIIEQTENTNLTGGKEIFKGLVLKHKSGKWILSNDKNDVNADDIGGCTEIPIIEFDKKLIEWC